MARMIYAMDSERQDVRSVDYAAPASGSLRSEDRSSD